VLGGILCNLAKAFECMYDEISLAKLHFCGIQVVSEDWFRSCLTERIQEVEIKFVYFNSEFFH
jgi:hypothetical protein